MRKGDNSLREEQIATDRRGRRNGHRLIRIGRSNPRGMKIPDFRLKSLHEKLLDEAKRLLYCDPEFDRHFVISLS
jgi:hypothetical protein